MSEDTQVGLLDIDFLDDECDRVSPRDLRRLARMLFQPEAVIREIFRAESRRRGHRGQNRVRRIVVVR